MTGILFCVCVALRLWTTTFVEDDDVDDVDDDVVTVGHLRFDIFTFMTVKFLR